MKRMIDSHIHLDSYEEAARTKMLEHLRQDGVGSVVTVSKHMDSCLMNCKLSTDYPGLVHPAYGFHPEQPLPATAQIDELIQWIRDRKDVTTAIGEVGLPYYSRMEAESRGEQFQLGPYVVVLEKFVELAAELDKPIVLHAVYEDADIACGLLEMFNVTKAHFHWFKGSERTVNRMIDNGYFISFTPDIVYESEIQQLAAVYPLSQVMVETDGPWPFEGPFQGQPTRPAMIYSVIDKLAEIKGITAEQTAEIVLQNTRKFYGI